MKGAEIVVYTQGWRGDRAAVAGEEPTSLLYGRIVVDGRELDHAHRLTVEVAGGEWVSAQIALYAASIRFVPLTQQEFELSADDLAAIGDRPEGVNRYGLDRR